MANKITRAEEAQIPAFKDHREAIAWFKDKYSEDFVLQTVEPIGDGICHFYILIIDRKAYEAGMKQLRETGRVSGLDFVLSNQPVQIMEDGHIHIVY